MGLFWVENQNVLVSKMKIDIAPSHIAFTRFSTMGPIFFVLPDSSILCFRFFSLTFRYEVGFYACHAMSE